MFDLNGATKLDHQKVYEQAEYPEEVIQSVAVVTSVFSKPPLSEEWSVNGEVVGPLLRIPEVTNSLIKLLYTNGTQSDISEGRWTERWEIDRQHILNTIDAFLEYEAIEGYIQAKWILPEEMREISALRESLAASNEQNVVIRTEYPTKKLLDAYLREMDNPHSLVMLGGIQRGSPNVIFQRLGKSKDVNIALPLAVARIRAIEYESTSGVNQQLADELSHYLEPNELQKVLGQAALEDNASTIYLAEIGKVESGQAMDEITLKAGIEYFTQIVGGERDKLPKQMVYFTLHGTLVAEKGLATVANYTARKTVGKGINYTEEKIITSFKGIPMVFGVLKLNLT
ncbi:hypothetical protein IT417_00470 [bacterium]|nr:hypothetical protein [bacterium]